jgi:hypothetical protein
MTKSEWRALSIFTFVVLIVVLGLQSLLTRENAFLEKPVPSVAHRAP